MKTLLLAAALAAAPAPALAQAAPPAAPAPAVAPAVAPAAVAPARAARQPDANPALWVVRDEDTIIYLFGTIHLLDERPWFNDEVKTAFDASDELVMEAILPEDPMSVVPMIMRYALDQSGRKLSDRLTAAENAALARAVAPIGIPAAVFDRFEPWFASMILQVTAAQRTGINAANGPETILSQAAAARRIPVRELEGLEWQIHMFDNFPEEFQIAQLRGSLREAENGERVIGPLLAAWSAGDADGLARIMSSFGDGNPTVHRVMLTNRNATWARWIHDRMARPGTLFIAVGAAHLAGPNSVQAVLEAHGIHVERVPHVTAQ